MPNGRRQATGDWRLAAGDWRLATGDWRLATGDWRLATGDDANREQKLRGASVPCSLFPVPSIPDSLFPIPYSVLAAVPGHEAGANRRGAPRSTFHRPERSHAR